MDIWTPQVICGYTVTQYIYVLHKVTQQTDYVQATQYAHKLNNKKQQNTAYYNTYNLRQFQILNAV